MGHEIKYASYTNLTEEQREEKAIQDLFDYVGEVRGAIIRAGLEECKEFHEIDQMDIAISFAGVEGYPVRCAIKKYCGGQKVLEEWSRVAHWDKGHPIAPFQNNMPTTEG